MTTYTHKIDRTKPKRTVLTIRTTAAYAEKLATLATLSGRTKSAIANDGIVAYLDKRPPSLLHPIELGIIATHDKLEKLKADSDGWTTGLQAARQRAAFTAVSTPDISAWAAVNDSRGEKLQAYKLKMHETWQGMANDVLKAQETAVLGEIDALLLQLAELSSIKTDSKKAGNDREATDPMLNAVVSTKVTSETSFLINYAAKQLKTTKSRLSHIALEQSIDGQAAKIIKGVANKRETAASRLTAMEKPMARNKRIVRYTKELRDEAVAVYWQNNAHDANYPTQASRAAHSAWLKAKSPEWQQAAKDRAANDERAANDAIAKMDLVLSLGDA